MAAEASPPGFPAPEVSVAGGCLTYTGTLVSLTYLPVQKRIMAAEGDVELELETEENCSERPADKPRKHDSGAADLERVTDYAEEKEIQSSNLETAMSVIGDRRSREQKAKQEKEKELAKVTIKKEDVELIMHEMEIPRSAAERSLREHMGNVVDALIALTN
ncbi:huntingtin-interacting protein K [Engystomops pustulosus]